MLLISSYLNLYAQDKVFSFFSLPGKTSKADFLKYNRKNHLSLFFNKCVKKLSKRMAERSNLTNNLHPLLQLSPLVLKIIKF